MDLFEDDVEDNFLTVEFWAFNLLRAFAAVVIIPSWIILGNSLSAGLRYGHLSFAKPSSPVLSPSTRLNWNERMSCERHRL
jgi:hypothetical protein